MDRHVAFDALAVVLRWLAAHQSGVVLGQPISHLALRCHHSRLKCAQVPPSSAATSCSTFLGARSVVVRCELWHMVFNCDFPWRSVVKLYGEGGVTLSCGKDIAVLLLCQSESVNTTKYKAAMRSSLKKWCMQWKCTVYGYFLNLIKTADGFCCSLIATTFALYKHWPLSVLSCKLFM